jgi:hypothetical protein
MKITKAAKFLLPKEIKTKLIKFQDKRKIFGNEIKLLEGNTIKRNDRQSTVFFTTHKCASTYMNSCLNYINEKHLGLVHIDFMRYLWKYSSRDTFEVLEENKNQIFHNKGILYSPLRKYFPIPSIEEYRIILMLRDPRDVIVSHYYSMAYSHALSPNKERQEELLSRRSKYQQQSVDEYARDISEQFYMIYSEYCDNFIKRRNITFLKYEDFILDFEKWIFQLSKILGVYLTPEDKSYLFELKGGKRKVSEDPSKHVRKAIPGDFRDKLTKETQKFLNQKFEYIFQVMGYEP